MSKTQVQSMIYPEVPRPTRPPYWTTRLDSKFIKALFQRIVADYESGKIDKATAVELIVVEIYQRAGRVGSRYPSIDPFELAHATIERIGDAGLALSFDPARCRSPWSFFYSVVKNVARELLRQRKERQTDDPILVELKPDLHCDPLTMLARQEEIERVRERYLLLTRRQRAALLTLYPFLEPGVEPEPGPNLYVDRNRALNRLRRYFAGE